MVANHILQVVVMQGHGMQAVNGGVADVQCELRAICHDEELAFEKTSISNQTRDPVWEQQFGFTIPDPNDAQLEITLWDTSCEENDDESAFLGEVVLNVSKLVAYEGQLIEQQFEVKQGPESKLSSKEPARLTLRLLLGIDDGNLSPSLTRSGGRTPMSDPVASQTNKAPGIQDSSSSKLTRTEGLGSANGIPLKLDTAMRTPNVPRSSDAKVHIRIVRGHIPPQYRQSGEVYAIAYLEAPRQKLQKARTRLLLGSNELEFNEAFTFGIDHFILPKACARVSLEHADAKLMDDSIGESINVPLDFITTKGSVTGWFDLSNEESHLSQLLGPKDSLRKNTVYPQLYLEASVELPPGVALSEAAPVEKEFSEFMNFNQFEGNVGILWTTRAYGAPDAYNAVVLDLVPGSPASKNGLLRAGDVLLDVDGRDMAGKSKEEVEKLMIGPANTPITMIFSRPAPNQSKSGPPAEQVVVTLLRSKGPAQPRGADQPRPAEPRSMQHDAAPTTVRAEAQGLATRTQPRKAADAFPERSHPPLDAPGMFDPRGGDGYVQASSRSARNFRRSDIVTPMDEFSDISFLWGEPVNDPRSTELDSWKTKALYGPGIQDLQFISAPRQPERPRAMLPREQPVMRDGENFLPFRDSIVSKKKTSFDPWS
ncbi:hypothetical protein GUITHDRAFT_113142 [Guillardia theta CCMP2712]|uniref:PDZ domain-containing protein n=1 Tax=Guillardia theta (strain CCMP2712) TaxID=905079 RepID=L1IXS0_GUITC|nr:hypothetical protein GUITHDRAFT_113142 [Guillardia theta CCMP2712]EKX40882.1 hypothetical protein GUITHDRAFT_113142 [Guillardia theta CCMP2712]|eukprot:XP_005827862.1 hypothetical protein GUITHDRAFT_113142 [Guillardia theta CCMP2712]